MRIAKIKGDGKRFWGGNAILERCVLSLERKIGKEFVFRVSRESEFKSRGPMTEKAILPSDDLTHGMERKSVSEDLVETEYDGIEKTIVKIFTR